MPPMHGETKKRIKTDLDTCKIFRSDLEAIYDLPAEDMKLLIGAILQAYDDFAPRFDGASKREAGLPDLTAPPYNLPPHLLRKGKRIVGNILFDICSYWELCDNNAGIRALRGT